MANPTTDPTDVSLPAGTGFSSGMGESFAMNLNTGQGNFTVPISVPDGVAGCAPRLKLEYVAAATQGPFGLGWQIPLRSIERRLDLGVPPADGGLRERFLDGNVELFPLPDGSWGNARETAFQRYTRTGDGWILVERNGTRHELGLTPAGRVADPANADRVQTWLLERSVDTSGNDVRYRWRIDGGTPYLDRVDWSVYELRFTYETRPDPRTNGRAGFLRTLGLRCSAIDLFVGEARRITTWRLAYTAAASNGMSLLASVQLIARAATSDGDIARRPITFSYSPFDPTEQSITWLERDDGVGLPSLDDPDVALCVLDDLPLPGLLHVVDGAQYYWANRGELTFGEPRRLQDVPRVDALGRAGALLIDMDGDGTIDLAAVGGAGSLHGYYANGGGDDWRGFVAYPRARGAEPAFAQPSVRATDVDGDGRVDAIQSRGRALATWTNLGADGWSGPVAIPVGDLPALDFADPFVRFADMTGDGLADVVRIRSGAVEYWPNLGNGTFGARVLMPGSPRLPGVNGRADELQLVDIDGDGVTDLVRVSSSGLEVWINQGGNGFAPPFTRDIVPPLVPRTLRAADLRGIGRAGLVWNSPGARGNRMVYCQLGADAPAYCMAQVDNGAGLVTTFEHHSAIADALRDRDAGAPWSTFLPFAPMVVGRTREVDGVSGRVSEVQYQYHDGNFSPALRQFEGFARVDKRELGDASRPDQLLVHHFHARQELQPGHGPEHAFLNGILQKVEVISPDGTPLAGQPFRVELTSADVQVLQTLPDARQRVFVFVTSFETHYLERSGDERVEQQTFTYDAWGNVTREAVRRYGTRAGVAQPEERVVSDISYAVDTASGILDRPAHIVRRDGDGKLLEETRRYYDGTDFVGLAPGRLTRGLKTREERWILTAADFSAHYGSLDAATLGYASGSDADGNPAWFAASERFAYDTRGLQTAEMNPIGRVVQHQYDPTGRFRVARIDATGTSQMIYDPAIGRPTRIIDPQGGAVDFAYDALGRISYVVLPGDTAALPSRQYTYQDAALPGAVHTQYRIDSAKSNVLQTAAYFDGRGNEIQRRVPLDAHRVIVSAFNEPNPWGDPRREWEPVFDTSLAFAVPATSGRTPRQFFYDAVGRPVRTINYNGGVSTANYLPFETIIGDANDNDTDTAASNSGRGTPRREEYSVSRRRLAVIEDTGNGVTLRTDFQYSSASRLSGFSDGKGPVASYGYDGAGNRLSIHHRDAGTRNLFYDAGGRVVRTVDGPGAQIDAVYDDAGRISTLSQGGVVVERYTYDAGANGWNRLTSVSYPGGSQRFGYNARGQVIRQDYSFDGDATVHTLQYEYNALGRETRVQYPGGGSVQQDYYVNGLVRSVPGYVDLVDYDARALPTSFQFHNGVVTSVDYAPGPGRVTHQRTTGPHGEVYADEQLGFDPLQQLTSRQDLVSGRTTRYTLDPLSQLTAASDERSAADARSFAYRYDGRDLTYLGESDTTLAYADAAHTGRVTSIASGGTSFAITYDGNGNISALPGRRFTYDHKNQLVRVDRDDGTVAEYVYDHRGQRVAKRVTQGGSTRQTLILANSVEIESGQASYYVLARSLRVALVSGGRTRYLHSDDNGSVRFFTDENGTRIAQIAYAPFGNVRDPTGSVSDELRLFALHPYDSEAGLYSMGRRQYAPEIGRFITPDPMGLYDPMGAGGDPARLALYTYVENDPLDRVDPHGLFSWQSLLGAIVGVIVGGIVGALFIASLLCGVGFVILAIVGIAALATAGYIGMASTSGGWQQFFKGLLIGFNAGLNFVFALTVTIATFGLGAEVWAWTIGLTIGTLNFLACIDEVAKSPVYQGILGWANWVSPMSWVVLGLGLAFFVISALADLLSSRHELNINSVSMDWSTGTLFMTGGLVGNAARNIGFRAGGTAFDMGNFAFIDRTNPLPTQATMEHEAGHSLSLGAFGSVFHLVGFLDEQALRNGTSALAEQIAESHVSSSPPQLGRPRFPMWGLRCHHGSGLQTARTRRRRCRDRRRAPRPGRRTNCDRHGGQARGPNQRGELTAAQNQRERRGENGCSLRASLAFYLLLARDRARARRAP